MRRAARQVGDHPRAHPTALVFLSIGAAHAFRPGMEAPQIDGKALRPFWKKKSPVDRSLEGRAITRCNGGSEPSSGHITSRSVLIRSKAHDPERFRRISRQRLPDKARTPASVPAAIRAGRKTDRSERDLRSGAARLATISSRYAQGQLRCPRCPILDR